MSYLQHGRRHGKQGSDPISGLGVDNDWVTTQSALGVVAPNTSVDIDMAGSIAYQTDDGSIYGEVAGSPVAIGMFQIGTYLIRVRCTFAEGLTGYAMGDAVIAGPVTTYNYNTTRFMPMSVPDAGAGTDFGFYGGYTIWEQLCVVNDLSVTSTAFVTFNNNSGNTLAAGSVQLQIFRLT